MFNQTDVDIWNRWIAVGCGVLFGGLVLIGVLIGYMIWG